ncbi:MAG: class I tRNA ligase family protein [Candidatus Pacebacteria bacterium]|nr:class I tRNA ligase family protein [Candidatus Paceibacterota bacterium]
MNKEKTSKYFTTPIYYVNDKPHIGHAYTTLAIDVLTRYGRLLGQEVFFLTGTDEHGAKIAQAAEKSGKNPQDFCDEISGLFKEAWKNLNIDYSYFIRTTDKQHEQKVKEFLTILKDKGYLYEGEYQGLYCVGCEKFITEKELVNGECPDHKCPPQKVAEKNWFFKLKEFLPQIEGLIVSGQLLVGPEQAKQEVLGLFRQGLDDISISRQNVAWGIKLPWDENQTCYVWVDALLNYWTALQQEGRQYLWPADLHLVGRDILKFHCIYWPALLLAAGFSLPKQVFAHGYFTINGQKMSKTIGNIIDPNDLVKKYGVDATRYLLLSQFPFSSDGDISLDRLGQKYNSDLAKGLGNLTARIVTLAGKISIKGSVEASENKKLAEVKNNYTQALGKLNFYEALSSVWDLISYCDKIIDTEKPWENRENSQQAIAALVVYLEEITKLITPFLPETSEKISQQIQGGKSVPLFPRLP